MRTRPLARAVPLLLVLALGLAACGGAAPTPSEALPTEAPSPAAPVVLRIGMSGSPDSRNPGNAYLTEAFDLIELVYDALVYIDFAGNYHPELAEGWTVSDDGLTWTFTLRDGVQFADGTPLTAEDVAFSLLAYRDWADFGYISGYTTHFADVQATDERTVVLTLDTPIGNLESQLLFCYILPKHVWEPFAGDLAAALEFENAEMIGSGPFRLVEFRQGEFYRLAANKDHYLFPPNVDEVIFQTYANQDALVQALRAGEVDMITEMPNTVVPTLRGEADITVVSGSSRGLRDYIFNVIAPADCPVEDGGICSGHPALRDPVVRQAMAHAVDKQQIIDVALLGLGAPGIGLVPQGLGDYFASELLAEDYAFDITLANQMLDEAGYLDTNGDGIRECPASMDCSGRQLDIVMQIPSDVGSGPREAELLSGWWSQIGIRMTPQVLEPDTVTANCCPAFDFDMLVWGWTSDPDPLFILSVLTSDEIPTGLSETGYNNPEYDRLFAEQAVELDRDQRIALVHEMQRLMLQDLPYIIPYYDQEVQAFRNDRFAGWPVPAEGSGDLLYFQDPLSLTAVRPVQ
ncbi:MAG: ABC transporter substrate-binding protein [Chloroflexota bacterium]